MTIENSTDGVGAQQTATTQPPQSAQPLASLSNDDAAKIADLQLTLNQYKTKIDEFRSNNIALLKEKESINAQLQSLTEKHLQAETKLSEKAKMEQDTNEITLSYDQKITTLKSEYESKISELSTALQHVSSKFDDVLLQSTLKDLAVKEGVVPTALEDVILRGRNSIKIVENTPKVVGSDGKPLYNKDNKEISVDEWMVSLKKTAPHLFYTSTGGGAPGSKVSSVVDDKAMSPVNKIMAGLGKLPTAR